MAKTDSPPFRMLVEKGPRLVPATASDAERLDTWRVGSAVNVAFVRNGSRVMERKWWAVLGLVVERCNVPWKTKEQASEAVKLALGIVNLTKTVGGAWMQYPKSLTELDDPELDAAVRDMMDLIQKMTGIDPDTLRKETADVGADEDESEQPETSPPNDSGSGSSGDEPSPSPGSAAADNSSSAGAADQPEAGAPSDEGKEADHGDAAASASGVTPAIRLVMDECISNMLRDAFSDPKDKQAEKVEKLRAVFLEPQNLGAYPDFVNRCAETVHRIIGKPAEKDRAREYLKGRMP